MNPLARRNLRRVDWHPAVRIIPTRFPSVNLFDRVASAQDFEILYQLEAMTNDRLRDELGEISLVPQKERIYGDGCGPIMAAFTHLNPLGSRFSDGSYGVFYAARDKATAVAETRYHQANFMRATNEAPLQLQMRVYHVEVSGRFDDITALPMTNRIYDKQSYMQSQLIARKLREQGSAGILYQSVRIAKGQCIAAFKTIMLSNCRHASQMLYQWDGAQISEVYEKL